MFRVDGKVRTALFAITVERMTHRLSMSLRETAAAVELIRQVTEGRTLVMVEHDMGVVFGLAQRISVLVYGEVIATGTPEAIRNDRRVKEAYLGTTLDEGEGAVSASEGAH